MSLNAISTLGAVGALQPSQPQIPAPDPTHQSASETASAKPIASGTPNPLSSSVLAALVTDDFMQRGSFAGP